MADTSGFSRKISFVTFRLIEAARVTVSPKPTV